MDHIDRAQPLLLDFAPTASLDDLAAALRAVLEMNGCTSCGRLSIYLRAMDPGPLAQQLVEIPSFRTILPIADRLPVEARAITK